ncbi:hypothetical protein AB0907_24015 [Streptomyces sp. NPDC006975]|uniref:hypothetical protein n=1 Tax=Streptomyces sp. NPDC006975 TaxID=3154310 RepID=UPI003456BEDF
MSRSSRSGKGEVRDVEADYKAAYIAEHASYKASGRTKDADAVAEILRDRYGYDVDAPEEPQQEEEQEETPEEGEPETTAAEAPPEAAVEPKPTVKKAVPARKAAAKKTAAAPEKD